MRSAAPPFAIDDELAAFLTTGGCSLVAATRSAALVPHAARVCGLRVVAPDRIELLVPRATGARLLEDMRQTGDVAVSVSSPVDYRTIQLKGRFISVADATAEDLVLAQEQLQGFSAAVARHGMTRQQARNLWLLDFWRVEVLIIAGFSQTPGLGAGRALARR